MKCVILQPSYIPWRGYFHQIQKADIFVFYDCVQYDEHGWRNRNKIKTPHGEKWLTIPVKSKGCHTFHTPILEIPIEWKTNWPEKHLKSLKQYYGKTPYFLEYKNLLEKIYSRRDERLADFTCATTELIARELGISHTRFLRSSHLPAEGGKTDRLLSILRHLGATHYISGPSAEDYIEKSKFSAAGIKIEFMNYSYPKYPQNHGPFSQRVSILDLILNVGPKARHFIWGK